MWNVAWFYGGDGKREIVTGRPVVGFAAAALSRCENSAFGLCFWDVECAVGCGSLDFRTVRF